MRRIILFIILILTIQLVSSIRINEIEANPYSNATFSDAGNEWFELYSETNISVDGWNITRADGKNYTLSGNFTGHQTFNISIRDDESLYLIDKNSTIIDSFVNFKDNGNNDTSWQYCETLGWIMKNSTRGQANNCTINVNNTNQTNNNNQTQTNNTLNTTNSTNSTIKTLSLTIDSPKSAYVDEEIELKISINNILESDYDFKASIINKDNKIISETYNEAESLWASSFYYIENFFSGPGNINKKIIMRIPTKNSEYGEFTINIKVRKSGSTSYVETSKNIEILESSKEEESVTTRKSIKTNNELNITNQEQRSITGKVIYLNSNIDASKGIKSNIIYRSKNDKIKEYTIYVFTVFCVLIIIYLLIKK